MKNKITKADRMRIVHEYETSDLTYAELAQKHGLPCGNTIASWRRRLHNSEKSRIFAGDLKPRRVMQDAERQELESQIADLKQRLHKAEMQNLALNTLIDVAEEQGLAIRKKCGAKQ